MPILYNLFKISIKSFKKRSFCIFEPEVLKLQSPKSNQFSALELQMFHYMKEFFFLNYRQCLNPDTLRKKNSRLKLIFLHVSGIFKAKKIQLT